MARKPIFINDLIVVGESQAKPQVEVMAPTLPALTFDAWWLLTQSRLGLSAALKQAIKCHMKSKGFLDNGRFDDGLKDFGL